MKKLSTFFLTLLLSLVATTAFAFDYTAGQVIKIGEAATTPETGQAYLMCSVGARGYIYAREGAEKEALVYATLGTNMVYTGMAAEDAEQYLVELTGNPATLNYDILIGDYYLLNWDGNSKYSYLWTNGYGNQFYRINGTKDCFSIVGQYEYYGVSNCCLYTWSNQTYACATYSVSDPASVDSYYQYQFLPVDFVDPSELPTYVDQPEPGEWDDLTIDIATSPAEELEAGQWYLIKNTTQYHDNSSDGGYLYPQPYEGHSYSRLWVTDGLEFAQSGMAAADVQDYLVRFIENETDTISNDYTPYLAQFGTGDYWYMTKKSTTSQYIRVYSEEQIEEKKSNPSSWWIYPVNASSYPGKFAINYPEDATSTSTSAKLYAQGSGGYCSSTSTGITSTGADNWSNYWYYLYPVNFIEEEPTLGGNDNDYEIGDEVIIDRKTCTVVGENLFVNGGFNDGMNGWTAGGYTTAADPDNFDIQTSGGYNDGAYLVASSEGTGNAKTPSQAIAVEVGKWYMFVAYTSGKTPDSNNLRYSALFEMNEDGTAELSHAEGNNNYSNDIITLDWGVDSGEKTDEWTQTIGVFEATTDYVGMRMGWSGGSYDGFQLYEVEVEEMEPEYVYETVYECVAEVDHWSIAGNTNGDFHLNTWSSEADASNMEQPFLEYWVGSWEGTLSAATISHETLTDLPAGDYEATLDIRILNEIGTAIGTGTMFNANGVSVDLVEEGTTTSYGDSPEVYGTYTVTCTVGDAGTLDISVVVPSGVSYNWIAFKNLKVAMKTSTADIELTAVEGPMNAEVQAAMEDAIAAFDASLKADDYYAAVAAIEAAEASVAYYAPIVAAVDALDDAGAAVWAESDYAAALADRTLTNEDVNADLATAQKAQVTAGSDMTYVALYDGAWAADQGNGPNAYNTFATETYIGEEEATEGIVLYNTIEDLTPGTYTVSFYVAANMANGVTGDSGEGITEAYANGEVVAITVGTNSAAQISSLEDMTLVSITCTVDEDGVLEFGLQNVADGGNWFLGAVCSLTLVAVEGEEPVVEEGDYLIVDADGNYLGGGLIYGTQAAIIGKPQFIGFELQEDGTYHLDSHQYNNASAHYLGSNLYFDNGTPVDWTVEAVDGGYTIYGTVDDGTGYLTSNGFQTVATVGADPYVWTLLTIEDVIAGMDEATLDAPVDVTALIAAPEMKRNSNSSYYPTWTVTAYSRTDTVPSNYAFGGGSAVANCAESYHSTNGFNFSQEITLPLAGYYTLSAQGFYRDDSSETLLLPVMYVDDQSVEFPEITRDDEYLGVADNMANAYQEFLLGLHPIDAITIEATEDGQTVTIGFKGEDTSLWQIMGELTLLYSGAEAIEPEPEVTGTYVFVAEEWVASDDTRVTADNITYNDDNTITVVASGTNNVALGNNPSQSWNDSKRDDVTTANYTISKDQCNFVVIGSNLSTEEGDSYWWWMNGINDWDRNWGQIAPDEIYLLDDDQLMFVWDLTYDITNNMTADEEGLITLNGCTCFGLTSTTGTSVISDINFYTNEQVTAITGGTATLIENVETAGTELAKEGIYTMSGVRLNKITKSGIYIVDGKKVLVK